MGYQVTLLFFWLSSTEMAKQRVADRVSKGGHNIPAEVIERRYYRGISNLIDLYMPLCDSWMVIDNMDIIPELIAKGGKGVEDLILNNDIWNTILKQNTRNGR